MRIKYGLTLAIAITTLGGGLYAGARQLSLVTDHSVVKRAALSLQPAGTATGDACPPGFIDGRDNSVTTALPECEGRAGDWYGFHDESPGTTLMFESQAQPGVNGAGRAIHALGSCENAKRSGSVWGAGFGFDLNNPTHVAKGKKPYDALGRGFKGIRFKARTAVSETTEGAVHVVSVRLPDVNTDPLGGRCSTCWDDYAYSINVDTKWRSYTILWSDLVHAGTGLPDYPFAANAIISVHWRFLPSDVFNLYVDDVEFVR